MAEISTPDGATPSQFLGSHFLSFASERACFGDNNFVPKIGHACRKYWDIYFWDGGKGSIIGIADAGVKEFPMNRPLPSDYPLLRKLGFCFVALLLTGTSAAQSAAQSASGTPSTTVEPAVVDASAKGEGSQTAPELQGQLPTAAEVESAGARAADPADPPATAVTEAKPAAAPAVVPPVPTSEPAKYDVSLIGHRNVGNGVNFYSIEREMAVGRDLARQVEDSSRLVTDPAVVEYINRIGQNLVRNSDSRVPFTIKVLDDSEVNAFALPGGFFYVDSGLILAADNEAELAGIMAHEIAHVAARHATKNMTKQQIWNMASIPLMFIGGPAGLAIAEVASIAVPMGFLKFSRDAEREADMLGLQYDYAAGYDPQAFVQFFEKLKMEEGKKHSKIAKLFSTHPMNSERITAAQNEIRTYLPDRDSYIVDTSDFEAVKARLIALQGGLRLHAGKGGNRPVLHMNTGPADAGDVQPPSPSDKSKTDISDDHPTLKRVPVTQN
jgi:Peptidase family M48